MAKKGIIITMLVTAFLLFMVSSIIAQAEKPKITPICKQCHAPDDKIIRGTLGAVSAKAETIQVQVGSAVWLVRFDDNTKVVGAEKITAIPREKEIAVVFREKDGVLYAERISVKQPAKVPAEKLIKTEELDRLIKQKADIVIIDSRPAPRYHEGHIPGAISIYDAEFDKHIDKLPKEKDKLLVFYCGGVT